MIGNINPCDCRKVHGGGGDLFSPLTTNGPNPVGVLPCILHTRRRCRSTCSTRGGPYVTHIISETKCSLCVLPTWLLSVVLPPTIHWHLAKRAVLTQYQVRASSFLSGTCLLYLSFAVALMFLGVAPLILCAIRLYTCSIRPYTFKGTN